MGHPQPTTPVEMVNFAASIIVNGMAKQKISRAIDMRFYWVHCGVRQNHFRVFWEDSKKNMADYFAKIHPNW